VPPVCRGEKNSKVENTAFKQGKGAHSGEKRSTRPNLNGKESPSRSGEERKTWGIPSAVLQEEEIGSPLLFALEGRRKEKQQQHLMSRKEGRG